MAKEGFNPLNQVYVFNTGIAIHMTHIRIVSFNPLNQVYVFNKNWSWFLDWNGKKVLIP